MQGKESQLSTSYRCPEQMRIVYMKFFLIALFSVIIVLYPETNAFAQEASNEIEETFCYAIADGTANIAGQRQNRLVFIDTATGNTSPSFDESAVMDIEYFNSGEPLFGIDAISFAPVGGALYAAKGDQLGILNLVNGNYRPLPNTFGRGSGFVDGLLTTISFEQVISLGFDLRDGILYGINRDTLPNSDNAIDMLIAIDYTTGASIPKQFTINDEAVDFVLIEPTDESYQLENITADPVTGVMYGVVNSQEEGIDQLAIIDKDSGITTEIGYFLRRQTSEIIMNMEGISYSNRNGALYGITGESYKEKNLLWQIDKNTGTVQQIGAFQDSLSNFKSLACSTNHSAIHLEKSTTTQGITRAPGPYMQAGEGISWRYLVANTGIIPLVDILVVDEQAGGEVSICAIDRLEPGQNNLDIGVTCEYEGTVERGQYQGTATATGIPELLVGESLMDRQTTYYFGYTAPAVGDYVWFDSDFNGIQDIDEVGIEGIDVTLICSGADAVLDTADDFIRTQKTAILGHYLFDAVPIGECYITFGLSSSYSSLTFSNMGLNEDADSDPFEESGRTEIFQVEAKDHLIHWDAGLLGAEQVATVGTYVWNDQNYNGLQDMAEPGMGGIPVELYNADDQVVNRTETNPDGFYLFTTAPGDYYIKFVLPPDHEFTLQNQGDDEQLDSDAQTDTGLTNGLITLSPGENDLSWDAGLCARPLLEVYITDDTNAIQPGDTIIYRLSYENLGLSDSTDVFITEIVPEHTTFDPTNSSAGWVCQNNGAGSQCVFSVGDVPAQSSTPPEFDLTFAVIVDAPILLDETTSINNQVQIRDANECNEALSGTATATEQTPLTTPTGIDELVAYDTPRFFFFPVVNVAN